MKKFTNLFILSGLIGLALIFYAFMTPTGSPGARTGSPGDSNLSCTACHTGTANNVSGWITTNIPPTGYVPGASYTITVTGTHTGVVMFGFEATAESSTNAKVGTFSILNSTTTKLCNNNKAVTHKQAGTTPTGNTKTWSFGWTAPSPGVGTVTFYSALLAANGNGSNSGDVTYKTFLAVNQEVPNAAPVFSSVPVTEATVGIPYTYAVVASDENPASLSFSLTVTPVNWLTLTPTGPGTATLSGDPANAPAGTTNVVVSVSDGVNPAVNQPFTITVIPNEPPVFLSGPGTEITQGFAYSYLIEGSDANPGSLLTLTAPVLPAWLSLTSTGNGTGSLSGTPDATVVGPQPVSLALADAINAPVFQNFTVTVLPNLAPSFSSTPTESVQVGNLYSYSIQGSDANSGTTLALSAPTLPSWLSFAPSGNGTAVLTGTPATSDQGTHQVVLELSDGFNNPVSQSFSVLVQAANGFDQPGRSASYTLMPNPAIDRVEVSGPGIRKVRLLATDGKTLRERVTTDPVSSLTLSTTGLPSGRYLVEVSHTRGVELLHLFKK